MKKYIKPAILTVRIKSPFLAGSLEDQGDGSTSGNITPGTYDGEFDSKKSTWGNVWE